MSDKPSLVVVGATGVVGRQVLQTIGTRANTWSRVIPLASERGYLRTVPVLGGEIDVQPLREGVFDGHDVVIFATPDEVSARWAPLALDAGLTVIDNSEAFAADPSVPLVVSLVNGNAVQGGPRIISCPGGVTLTVATTLHSLHQRLGLTEVVMSAYVAASLAGEAGIAELYAEASALAGNAVVGQTPGDVRRFLDDLDRDSPFPAPLAFNLVPWVGDKLHGTDSGSEARAIRELRGLLRMPKLPISLTCVQVPVVRAHAASLHLAFERPTTRADVVQALTEDANAVVVLDDPAHDEWPTPSDVVGTDPVFAGRIRHDPARPNAVDMFLCTDNLRQGSALNLVELAELAVR